jgi:DNA damage-binding protein 1
VSDFTAPGTNSLLTAKPDRLEVWDVGANGLTPRGELLTWGTVAGLAAVNIPDARPHVLLLVGPPNARLLLLTWDDGLVVTSSHPLAPPTPALRRQEFFTGVVVQGSTALVSVWTGLLACMEMELEKARDLKRRASVSEEKGREDKEKDGRRLVFKLVYNLK